jgi:nicotinamide phosphoribosyltransferase
VRQPGLPCGAALTATPPGYFPVRLEALPEGTVVHANCPVYQARVRARRPPPSLSRAQITSENEYACLCTFLETLLTMVWHVVRRCIPSRLSRPRQVPLLRRHAR